MLGILPSMWWLLIPVFSDGSARVMQQDILLAGGNAAQVRYGFRIEDPCQPLVEWLWGPVSRTPWQQQVLKRAYTVWEHEGSAPGAFDETDFYVVEYESCLEIQGWKHRSRRRPVTPFSKNRFLHLNKQDLSIVESCVSLGYDPETGSNEQALRMIGHDPDEYECRPSDVSGSDAYFPADAPEPSQGTTVCSPKQTGDRYSLRILDPCQPQVVWLWDPPSRTPWQQQVFKRVYDVWKRAGTVPAAFDETDFYVREYESCLHIEGWKHSDRRVTEAEDGKPLIRIGGTSDLRLNKQDLSVVESCEGLGYRLDVRTINRALRVIGHDIDLYECRVSDSNRLDVYFPDDGPGPPESAFVCTPKPDP